MNLREFRLILAVTFFLNLFLLSMLAAILTWQIERTLDDARRVDHSDKINAQLHDIQGMIMDRDASLREYGSNRNSHALEVFHAADAPLETGFNHLAGLAKGNADTELRVRQLRDSYALWLGLAQQIESATTSGSTPDAALISNEQQMLIRLHEQFATMHQVERIRRQEQRRATSTQERRLVLALPISCIAVGCFLGIFTQRNLKRVSQAFGASLSEANKRTEELSENRLWLQTTLDSIDDALIASDRNGRIEFMNPVAQKLTGWSLSEAQGRPMSEVFRVSILQGENASGRATTITGAADGGNRARAVATASALERRGGGQLLIEHKASPIVGARGEVKGVVLVFRDVTEKRRAEAALLANEKLAVAGRLAASIAHEIHNPLDAVANLHYLIEHEEDPAQKRRFLAMAQQELSRTLQISRAMLGLYRESKAPVAVDLRELLESVLLLLDRRLKDQSIQISQDLAPDVTVDGFPGELRQVFTNLITNAADAAGSGGRVRVRLEPLSTRTNPGGAEVCIADSGPGIPQDLEEQLFQPFFTTKGEGGTGLGLWVSRGIVERHGGKLEISNSIEDGFPGAKVRVTLPARAATFEASQRAGESASRQATL